MLLPLAISEGWTVRDFAAKAHIETGKACELLKSASEQVATTLEQVPSVDALALSVPINGVMVTLGKIQGQLVTGAVKTLSRIPAEPDLWEDKHDKAYRRAQLILRDAKALGLIRFGDSEKAEKSGGLPALAGYLPRLEPKNPSDNAESPVNKGSVNDGGGRSQAEAGTDTLPAEETREE